MVGVAQWVEDVGIVAGVVTAVVVAGATVGRTRPFRWLLRTLVGQPLAAWFRREVGEVVDEKLDQKLAPIRSELQFNGGHTIKDQVEYLTRREKAREANP